MKVYNEKQIDILANQIQIIMQAVLLHQNQDLNMFNRFGEERSNEDKSRSVGGSSALVKSTNKSNDGIVN